MHPNSFSSSFLLNIPKSFVLTYIGLFFLTYFFLLFNNTYTLAIVDWQTYHYKQHIMVPQKTHKNKFSKTYFSFQHSPKVIVILQKNHVALPHEPSGQTWFIYRISDMCVPQNEEICWMDQLDRSTTEHPSVYITPNIKNQR